MQSRALKIIGLTECNALKIHGITTVRDFIANTCVNVLKRILCDPTHPLTIKHTREILRFTKASFPFEYSRARTEAYNNSIVPWGIRLLRDGREDLYKPVSIAKALKKDAQKKRPASISTNQPRVPSTTSTLAKCRKCGESYKLRGIKIHERSCKEPTSLYQQTNISLFALINNKCKNFL